MKVNVLFFGATADAAGTRELRYEGCDANVVAELIEKLKTDHPALARQKLLAAVNEDHVPYDTALNDGDTVAIFTPVSGG